MTSDMRQLPIINITNENISNLTPSVLNAINTSSFLALDLELSGLGKPDILKCKDMEDRYSKFSEVVKSRAVLSLGISTFKHVQTVNDGHQYFLVQTFNFSLLSRDLYIVDPSSLQFLTSHGFDFNQQYSHGIPYNHGNDKVTESDSHVSVDNVSKESESPIRQFLLEIIKLKKPVVLHNGFIDLMFIYHHFYAQLPPKYLSFVADLYEMFPTGIFDTKFLLCRVLGWQVTFLSYGFRKCQRLNLENTEGGKRGLIMSFPNYPQNFPSISKIECAFLHRTEDYHSLAREMPICMQFTRHGWCNSDCKKSHNLDLAIDHEFYGVSPRNEVGNEEVESSGLVEILGAHRAGFDAFMTGFIMAFVMARYGKKRPEGFVDFGMTQHSNKVFLTAKGIPLVITKSAYAKTSPQHRLKFDRIFKQ